MSEGSKETPGKPKAQVIEVRRDAKGGVIARRLQSASVGELWITEDRATAVRLGLVGRKDAGSIPVYYLGGGEMEFLKGASEEALRAYHSFKSLFDSPEPVQ